MWNLVKFFTRNSPFFTWLGLSILCLLLLFNRNPYQRSVWFSSSNLFAGGVYDVSSSVSGYFGLRDINEDLLLRLGQLEAENLSLRQKVQAQEDDSLYWNDTERQYDYVIAHVVSNSINQAENYITIDKGSADSIHVGQGVCDQNGVVGLVANVSKHYSLVISVLNPHFALSACLKDDNAFGTLVWDGEDVRYAILENLPLNSPVQVGDTIVSTGYAPSFPRGIPVGRILSTENATSNNNFLNCKVELFTDFGRINNVNVVFNHQEEEQTAIMESKKEISKEK